MIVEEEKKIRRKLREQRVDLSGSQAHRQQSVFETVREEDVGKAGRDQRANAEIL